MRVFLDENGNLYVGTYSNVTATWTIWNKEERYLGFLNQSEVNANLEDLGEL
jgi:hypothetical protein